MATFYVGQRVQIKWSPNNPDLVGKEGIIVGRPRVSHWVDGSISDGTNWLVAPDCWGTYVTPRGNHFAPSSSQLEPLIDANDLVSWESMRDLWVPEQYRVVA